MMYREDEEGIKRAIAASKKELPLACRSLALNDPKLCELLLNYLRTNYYRTVVDVSNTYKRNDQISGKF